MEQERQDESTTEKGFELILLRPWQEIVGVLEAVFPEEPFFTVQLRTGRKQVRLVFEADSPETEQIRDALANCPVNSRFGIMMTDNETKPIQVRVIKE